MRIAFSRKRRKTEENTRKTRVLRPTSAYDFRERKRLSAGVLSPYFLRHFGTVLHFFALTLVPNLGISANVSAILTDIGSTLDKIYTIFTALHIPIREGMTRGVFSRSLKLEP